ncbi:hypothetical protein NMG60_11021043 [Bertholletia excelsa]
MLRRENRLLKSRSGSGNIRVPVLFLILILILISLVLLLPNQRLNQKSNNFESLIQFNPTVEFMNGTDVIWQIPTSPKAALFLAHGCNGRAVNFWDKSPSCPNCTGLPEERLIVLHALAHNFAVITISSAGRCWSLGKERLRVKGIMEWWVWKYKLKKLPLVALGASSGGYFVSVLATDLRFSSIVIMIAEGKFDQIKITKEYPPTLFVHMPKDVARMRRIDAYLQILKDKGIDVAEIKCMEVPLSPDFLADRIPGLNKTVSVQLFDIFQDKGFIDNNGYMRSDGREIHLKAVLRESSIVLPDTNLVKHITEELNLAFAYHEMTSLQSEHIFEWFESHRG